MFTHPGCTRFLALFTLAISCSLTACGSDDPDDEGSSGAGGGSSGGSGGSGTGGEMTGDCSTPVSGAPTADDIQSGASTVMCFYAPPEGYCREMEDEGIAETIGSNPEDKGAIGCASAVVQTDASCPTEGAIAKCEGISGSAASETRYYYPCNKFPDPAASCEMLGGTYTEL
jgi:hypothetical protein